MNQKPLWMSAAACLAAFMMIGGADAEDWPAYKKDGGRSSVTAERLQFPLVQRWAYEPSQRPRPAWPEPGKELNRVDFDYAFQPVIAGGLVYFGSSADDTVRALDIKSGKLVWRFVTEGPVRFAPAIARGKAYVVSDDGVLYCLNARTGQLLWRFRATSNPDRVIGNDRLIARYPCRSGALVLDDVVYITAGMWPAEGVSVYALDAADGRRLWCNDSSGSIYVDLPHALASGFSGVAPQGYLAASGNVLLVPTGRSVPAGFDRRTGRLLYYKPEKTHYHGASYGGGVWCAAAGDLYFNTRNRFQNPSEAHVGEAAPCPDDGMIAYSLATGDQRCHLLEKYRILVDGDMVYGAGNGSIEAIELSAVRQKSKVGPSDARWTTPHPDRVYCLAMAAGTLLTGDRGGVAAMRAADGQPVWRADLKGRQVRGMAIADGRLVAATNTGEIACFGADDGKPVASQRIRERPRSSTISRTTRAAAEDIIRRTGKSEGYALVVGERDTRLAEALAALTRLHVIALLPDQAPIAAERERLLDAGLLGVRVAAHSLTDPAQLRLPSYFADLVVVSRAAGGASPKECYRVLRPCGGTLDFSGFDDASIREFLRSAEIPASETKGGVVRRGELPGAGPWRYPWADGGRRGIGQESRVQLPLKLLWFGGPGPGRLVDRHLMGSPPVSTGGRVFLQGQHDVLAFDAYNGRELWSEHVPDVGRKYSQYYSSSLVADVDSVYVAYRDQCLRLDQASGRPVATYSIPQRVIKEVDSPTIPAYVAAPWPRTWRVIGPLPSDSPPLSVDTLKTLPDRVTVQGKEYSAQACSSKDGVIDFTELFGGYGLKALAPGETGGERPRRGKQFSYHDVGRICYALTKIDCPTSGKLLIGAGADWGMQWFLDGRLVYSALRDDSSSRRRGFFRRERCSPTDEVFDVDVTAGQHVLAVMVTAGGRGWALASASMAGREKEIRPVSVGADPNVPNLRDLVWGYLSVTDDLVLGSYNVPITEGQTGESHLLSRSESKALFALDKNDGSLRWVYRPRPGRVVANIEIAFGDGRLFLIDGSSKADLARARRRREKVEAELTLVALNLATGAELWRQEDVPLLGDRTELSRLKTNVTHLFMGRPNWGHLVYANGVVLYGANAAYAASDGRVLWRKTGSPGKLPVVYNDRIITSDGGYDLRSGAPAMTEDILTGQPTPWRYSHAYGCGPIAGCQHLLFFRSGADGFFDMNADGTTNFGGVRSGCARTLLAAGGLLIHPQGYSGCCCSYNFKTNLALIPAADAGDAWYVFPRRAVAGAIKKMAVNFGAPGDRKDDRGAAWLGFPRPLLDTACPAPLAISMKEATFAYCRGATETIANTDVPWVYSSGLTGDGRIAIDLTLRPGILLPTSSAAPAVDGALDEACWRDIPSIPFQNTPFSALGAKIDLRMFRDDQNIYFGYQCRAAADELGGDDPATPRPNDSLQIYLADSRTGTGIHLVLPRRGRTTATFGAVGTSRRIDPAWKGEWRSKIRETDDGWDAEAVLPISTLTDSGMDLRSLQLNGMAQQRTRSGYETVFLTDPRYGTKFTSCTGFQPIIPAPVERTEPRLFTVRLHFAELEAARPGQRVFDVAVQGDTVLPGLDIVRETGGEKKALVKEFHHVEALDRIVIDLGARSQTTKDRGAPPVICGLELEQEE